MEMVLNFILGKKTAQELRDTIADARKTAANAKATTEAARRHVNALDPKSLVMLSLATVVFAAFACGCLAREKAEKPKG